MVYFGRVQNYLEIEEIHKIVVYLDEKKNTKEIIRHKRTKMVKDGED